MAEPDAPEPYSLWLLTIAPTIWAAHFLLCYVTAAVWCAKFVPYGGPLGGVRSAVIWYTVVAIVGIAIVGWEGFRRHSARPRRDTSSAPWGATVGTETTTHDLDTREDRDGFLGFATLLLSGLSAVGVLYAAFAARYFETCR